MPDSTHPDLEVAVVYEQSAAQLRTYRRKKCNCIVAGDFNAQVGGQDEFDDPSIIGPNGFGNRNPRGEWFQQWCTTHELVVANTYFDIDREDAWTYRNGDLRKQLDYILMDKAIFKKTKRCGVQAEVDTGSDHRAVETCMAIKSKARARKKTKHDGKWSVDTQLYKKTLDEQLAEKLPGEASVDDRAWHLSKSMCEAGRTARLTEPGPAQGADPLNGLICDLIKQRRALKESSLPPHVVSRRRREICKEFQKHIRKRTRLSKLEKISKILIEFRGLKEIAGIKSAKGAAKIKLMIASDGREVTDKQGIADVFADFYEQLYLSSSADRPGEESAYDGTQPVAFIMQELQGALKTMKRNKAKDEEGVVAEMLKDGTHQLLEAVLDLFNDVLMSGAPPPQQHGRKRSSQ